MKLILSSHISEKNNNKGFTLVELLVTTLISAIILGASLSLIVDQRKQFVTDQTRTQVSQNLRTGMDLIGADVKRAGEGLEKDKKQPVIVLIDENDTNNYSDADELILQRKIIPEKLAVCEEVAIGASSITVSIASGSGLCNFSDGDADGFTDQLRSFREHRCEEDGTAGCIATTPDDCEEDDDECTWAYIYNTDKNYGEFFQYAFEDIDSTDPKLNRIYLGGSSSLDLNYPVADNPEIYLLEEQKYRLIDGVLELVVNQQDDEPLRLINQVQNFEVTIQASVPYGSPSFNPDRFNPIGVTPPWKNIEHIEVILVAENPAQSDLITISEDEDRRTLTSKFFPRINSNFDPT